MSILEAPYSIIRARKKEWQVMSFGHVRFSSKDKEEAEQVMNLLCAAYWLGQESIRTGIRDLLQVGKREDDWA